MKVAVIDESGSITVDDYRNLFQNVSFASTGPEKEWLDTNTIPVSCWLDHNIDLQTLVPSEPYLVDGVVYISKVVDKAVLC